MREKNRQLISSLHVNTYAKFDDILPNKMSGEVFGQIYCSIKKRTHNTYIEIGLRKFSSQIKVIAYRSSILTWQF